MTLRDVRSRALQGAGVRQERVPGPWRGTRRVHTHVLGAVRGTCRQTAPLLSEHSHGNIQRNWGRRTRQMATCRNLGSPARFWGWERSKVVTGAWRKDTGSQPSPVTTD